MPSDDRLTRKLVDAAVRAACNDWFHKVAWPQFLPGLVDKIVDKLVEVFVENPTRAESVAGIRYSERWSVLMDLSLRLRDPEAKKIINEMMAEVRQPFRPS